MVLTMLRILDTAITLTLDDVSYYTRGFEV